MLKKTISILFWSILSPLTTWSQRNSYPRSYEISGLQSADNVGTSFFYGLICVIIGIVIQKLSTTTDKNGKESTSNLFFLSLGFFFIAFIFFIPLLSWIEFAAMSLIGLVMFLAVVGFICFLIYGWIKK